MTKCRAKISIKEINSVIEISVSCPKITNFLNKSNLNTMVCNNMRVYSLPKIDMFLKYVSYDKTLVKNDKTVNLLPFIQKNPKNGDLRLNVFNTDQDSVKFWINNIEKPLKEFIKVLDNLENMEPENLRKAVTYYRDCNIYRINDDSIKLLSLNELYEYIEYAERLINDTNGSYTHIKKYDFEVKK